MGFVLRVIMLALSGAMFIASWQGIVHGFNMNSIIAFIIALVLLEFPTVLAIAAVYGAINAWDWPIWGAILLVIWPLALMIVVNGVSSIFLYGLFKKSNKSNEYDS